MCAAPQGELFELAHAEVRRFGGVTEKLVGDGAPLGCVHPY